MEWLRRQISSSKDPVRPVVIQVATVSDASVRNATDEVIRDTDGILEKHFHFLYLVGQCPRRPRDETDTGTKHKIHLVFFWMMGAFGIIQTLDAVKLRAGLMKKGDLDQLLVVGYIIIRGCIKTVFTYNVTRHWQRLKQLLKSSAGLEQEAGSPSYYVRPYVATPIAIVCMSTLRTLFGSLFLQDWSPREMILQRSFEGAYTLLLWRNETLSNNTIISELGHVYGDSLTFTNILLGCTGLLLDICGYLQLYSSWYLMLTLAISMQGMITRFETRMKLSNGWKYLTDLQQWCREADEIFGIEFKLLHLNNTMVFARFLLFCFIKVEFDIFLVMLFLDTVLILVTYWLAEKVSRKMNVVKQYVMANSDDLIHVDLGDKRVPVSFVFESLSLNPLGIGRGSFLIDEAFILRFLCIVGSYFVFMEQRQSSP